MTAEKSYLIDNFGEKGGLLHRCRDTTAVAFCSSLGFFSAGKKAEKLQHAEFEANLQMALSQSHSEKSRALPLFLAMETFGLFSSMHSLI